MEFGKCPCTMDKAVSEVVNFMETRKGRRDRKVLRSISVSSGSETEYESDVTEAKKKKKSNKKWGRQRRKINSLEGKIQKLSDQIDRANGQNKPEVNNEG